MVSDAAHATANAVHAILPDTTLLMCYFHVKYNIRKHLKGTVNTDKYMSVMSDISALYDCLTKDEYDKLLLQTTRKWAKDDSLSDFRAYFSKEWTKSTFARWQIFWTEAGMAHTNSPIESYNRQIKYCFTMCIKHSMRR